MSVELLSRRPSPDPLPKYLLTGVAAGLVAMAAAAVADRVLNLFVSDEQKRREKEVREGSPHEVAGPSFGRKLLGRDLSPGEERGAKAAFSLLYGVGWGLVHALVRRKVPQASRLYGLPFAVPFFVACDGAIAPLLGLTPPMKKVPWQLNAKELGNHAAWSASAEMVHRLGKRAEG